MGKLVLVFSLIMFFCTVTCDIVFAQTGCSGTQSPYNCDIDLRNPIAAYVDHIAFDQRSYGNPNVAISDVSYSTDVDPDDPNNTHCPTATTCQPGNTGLKYEVYYPDNYSSYQTCPLPAVVLFHAGGFSDCSRKEQGKWQEYSKEFTKRGFVAFNVEYRRGRIKADGDLSASQVLAMYRAFKDARGAIKTIVYRNATMSLPYKFDPSNLFIAGASAGAIIALNVAYYTDAMVDAAYPGAALAVGPLNEDIYNCPSTTTFSVKGVLSMWGGVVVPLGVVAKQFFHQNPNLPPLIAFHGAKDCTIPIDNVNLSYSSAPYNTENYCVNSPFTVSSTTQLYQLGSVGLYNTLKTSLLQVQCELYVDCDMGHGLDNNVTTDFGTSSYGQDAMRVYIIQRAAIYFQLVMANKQNMLNTNRFIERENYRNTCDAADNKEAGQGSCDTYICTATSLRQVANTKPKIQTTSDQTSSELFTHSETNKVIQLVILKSGNSIIRLIDLNGNTVRNIKTSNMHVMIDGSSLASGMYAIKVIQGNKDQTKKIILK